MIPRKIHYCWFGNNPKSEIIEKCIASWHRLCPDWEIIEWNETNYDISAHTYVAEAYASKKWAFVSDVARLEVVHKCGGIYLDTDVELLAPIEDLLNGNAFFFWETERNVNTGMGFGALAGHPAVGAMLSYYDGRSFMRKGKPDLTPCPVNNTERLIDAYPALIRNGCDQKIEDVLVLSLTEYNKYMKHYGAASWTDHPNDNGNKAEHKYKNTKLKRFLKQPKRFDYIESHFGKKAVKLYTFFVYDVMEYGIWYYLKKTIKRLFSKNK